jgi:signal peptidase I
MSFSGAPDVDAPGDRPTAWLLIPLTAGLLLVLSVFFVVFRTTAVDGESMVPTLEPQDRLLRTRDYGEPTRGDIVVVEIGEGPSRRDVIKRIVAVPGDEVLVVNDIAQVNGAIEAGYNVIVGDSEYVFGPVVVEPEHVFVLGDNRPDSLDSRYFGAVSLATVKGRAIAIYTPANRIRLIDRPASGE